MAISTIILLVLGVLILIALVLAFTGAWKKFITNVDDAGGSDMQRAIDLCEAECNLKQEYDFCCGEKQIGEDKKNCTSLGTGCEIDCEGVCIGG